MPRFLKFLPAVFFVVFLTSCVSTLDTIGPSWTPEVFFKNAQEAMDEQLYQKALFYYEVFLIRYPEDYSKVIAAEYQRAFIHYKIGNLKLAEEEMLYILKKYEESPYAMLYHPRFKTLCKIGLKNIEKKRATAYRLFWRAREEAWAKENGESVLDQGNP